MPLFPIVLVAIVAGLVTYDIANKDEPAPPAAIMSSTATAPSVEEPKAVEVTEPTPVAEPIPLPPARPAKKKHKAKKKPQACQ